jgi:hypothetical protein
MEQALRFSTFRLDYPLQEATAQPWPNEVPVWLQARTTQSQAFDELPNVLHSSTRRFKGSKWRHASSLHTAAGSHT